jgi:hypothetical protein
VLARLHRLPENLLALLATVLAIGAVLPSPYRLPCALGVVAIVLVLAFLRTRATVATMKSARRVDVYAKIARIRAERKARFRGRAR